MKQCLDERPTSWGAGRVLFVGASSRRFWERPWFGAPFCFLFDFPHSAWKMFCVFSSIPGREVARNFLGGV